MTLKAGQRMLKYRSRTVSDKRNIDTQ